MSQLVRPDWKIVSVGLLLKERKVLLGLRPETKIQKGDLWEFPGGRVEEGEHPKTTMIRELKEELNIQVKESEIADCLCDYSEKVFRLIVFFYVKAWEGEVKRICHQRLAWFSLEECVKRKIPNINPELFISIMDIISKKMNS